jgi:DNA-binding transcriptional LysR family regulator
VDLFADMELFIAVAQTRSFNAATRATGVPLSSVSRRIAALEDRLGVSLLNRTSRKVELTERGRVYLVRVRAIVDAAHAAEDELRAGADHPRGRLRVTMPPPTSGSSS